jgi:hypothetical protein
MEPHSLHTKESLSESYLDNLAYIYMFRLTEPARTGAWVDISDYVDTFSKEEFEELGKREFANVVLMREHPTFYAAAHLAYQYVIKHYEAR